MRGYSVENRNAFQNLRLTSILTLLDILLSNQVRTLLYIKRIYSEKAEWFSETLAYATRLGMIKQTNGDLQLVVDWPSSNEHQRRAVVLQNLLRIKNRYKSEILRFIGRFNVVDGDIIYFPSSLSRSGESAVRNFLIELGIVKYVVDAHNYSLASEHIGLYISARDKSNLMTPSALDRKLADKGNIGYTAEQKILSYERDRVGSSCANLVEHVSQKNVAAGYDIRSITLKDDGEILPRLIEVKAVPSKYYRFYWSRNELSIAQTLGDWYYLYLLPFDSKGRFDIDGVKIIANPYDVIMVGDTDWICESDATICSLKSNDSSLN